MGEEKAYIGTKIITAVKMGEHQFLRDIRRQTIFNGESREGYMVRYPDTYVSWSPKETFEIAYREVTPKEIELIAAR